MCLLRDKSNNTFKFIPFAERINNINVDVVHRVSHINEEINAEQKSYLQNACDKWIVQNRTKEWIEFYQALSKIGVVTLAQVVLNKDLIADLLFKHIPLQTEHSLQPVLEVLTAFVKDLRSEFYPYFEKTFKTLLPLLKRHDPDIIEWSFVCLAHIFKYLSKPLAKELDKVLILLAPILDESQPEYISNFAADSFAFVARNVHDKNRLFQIILTVVETRENLIAGCGRLIVAAMAGIKGRLHSQADALLTTFLELVWQLKSEIGLKLAQQVFLNYFKIINPVYATLFETLAVFWKEKIKCNPQDKKARQWELRLLNSALQCCPGKHVKKIEALTYVLLEAGNQLTEAKSDLVEIAKILCQKLKIDISQKLLSNLGNLMMQLPEEQLLSFVEEVCDCPGFESAILPQVLNMCEAENDPIFNTLAKIVTFKVGNLSEWAPYPLRLRPSVTLALFEKISMFTPQAGSEDISSRVFLLPHVAFAHKEKATAVLSELCIRICRESDFVENNLKLIFVATDALRNLNTNCQLDFSIVYAQLEQQFAKNFLAFEIGEFLLELCARNNKKIGYHDKIKEHAEKLLMSPYHKMRAAALRVLHIVEEMGSEPDPRMLNVLDTCLAVEKVTLNVQTFRDATLHIRELHHDKVLLDNSKIHIPFRFLLGYLYTNFTPVESEVIQALQSYDQAKVQDVWVLLMNQLSIENIQKEDIEDFPDHLKKWAEENLGCDDRVILPSYKQRILKCLNSFNLTEDQEKNLIDFALNFSSCPLLQKTWDYSCDLRADNNSKLDRVDLEESEEIRPSVKFLKKLLSMQLEIISKAKVITSHKYRINEIRKLCTDLLLDRDVPLRKSSLECLLTLSPDCIGQYRKSLIDLIDDEGFKSAVVFFQLDKEKGEVKDVHRKSVMPVVLRLLYSKMVTSVPVKRGNKSSAASNRRKQVMRFLGGCQEDEILEFLNMAFVSLKLDTKGITSSSAIADKMTDIQLDHVCHPRKLQSALNLADAILDHLSGQLNTNLQRFILHVILSIASTVAGVLLKREQVLSGYIPAMKKLRGTSLAMITKFFDKFDCFMWDEEDIDAVFRTMVWPSAHKLVHEGIHSPTPLLKLFSVWSKNPRYFVLLVRHVENDDTQTPLTFIMELLQRDLTQRSVTTAIANILENLLTLHEIIPMETDDDQSPVPLSGIKWIRPVNDEALEKISVKEELNYGSKLLLPHLGAILEFLRKQLTHFEKRGLGKTETILLARVTELASSAEHGDALIGLTLRILNTKPPQDEDVLVNTVATVKNLIGIVENPSTYIRPLACLFSNIESIPARKLLIQCIEEMAARNSICIEIAELVRDLNAYDRRWIDQCDFNKRLNALKQVRLLAAENKLSVDAAAFAIHSAFFFLRTEKDLSLRDSTEVSLKTICPRLLTHFGSDVSERQYLSETLLKLIASGVQGKDDRLKTAVISLLGVLARECSASHFIMNDLSLLTNKDDLEVDFFENIIHLQLYRRNKALLKLSSVVKSLTQPIGIRTVTQFLMPLVNQYLCNEKYSGKNTLVDAAIECVGTLCWLLPWHQYQSVLKYYLFKLRTQVEFQRQCIRTVIAILDAFHFDVSRACETGERTKSLKVAGEKLATDEEPLLDRENFSERIMDEERELSELMEELVDRVVAGDVLPRVSNEKEEITGEKQKPRLVEVITTLQPSAAKRVERAITGDLLEQLHKAIGQRTPHEFSHKLNRKALGPDQDEEDILRVPIAVAVVKLLQKLPGKVWETQLPGILTKLCTFLKSHLESVRRVTRETLQQIMISVGPGSLSLLLAELTSLLTKGFQVHVLVFTINSVIQALEPMLKPGDIDANLATILQVCSANLFGAASEEKDVFQLKVKHKEVRSHKSFNLFHLVSKFITEKCLTDLILPIKTALSHRNSHKMITKCRECLRQIVLGLAINQFIPPESLLIFLYGAASESIPQLLPAAPPAPKKYNPRVRQDCLLLAPEPKSRASSAPVKNSAKSGAHVIVEFGLHLLMLLLKQDRVKKMNLIPYLDPLVPVLTSALDSPHVKVSTLAVKCLTRLLKQNLPNLQNQIGSITKTLFAILHKYASAGLSKGDNFDLVLAVFKMVSVIVRDVKYYMLTQDQLRALLLYAEQDIHDSSRQAVAFGLLKAILRRKLTSSELHSVMLKVGALSITSNMEHVRLQARQAMIHYIMDYPLKSERDDLIGFYIGQFGYEEESGRKSALEMVFSMIESFPEAVLGAYSALFFLSLGTRLVNDESAECKKMIAAVIKGMLKKVCEKDRDALFDLVIKWLKMKKLVYRRLAIQLAGIFVGLEKDEFVHRLPKILPLIPKQFLDENQAGKFVRIVSEEDQALKDHHLFFVLVFLVKLSVNCSIFLTGDEYTETVSGLIDTSQNLLSHEHQWVRVGAAQFLGAVFNSIPPTSLAQVLNGLRDEKANIRFWDVTTFTSKFKSLVLDHTAQFVPGVEITQDFQDQLMKNLVYFARVLKDVSYSEESLKDEDGSNSPLTLSWLVRRMRRMVNLEIARTPSIISIRSAVLTWIGAVVVCLTKEELLPVLYHLAAPVVRELEVAQDDSPLTALAADVRKKLKKKVGLDEFTECSLKLQSKLMEKRSKRKCTQAQEFVIDPESAVKKKIEKHIKKKESRKRKIEIIRGKKPGKFNRKKPRLTS